MTVNVEMKPEFATATSAEKEFAAHELAHHIKSYIGISTHIEVKAVGTIERSVGKAKRVIDRRPTGLRRTGKPRFEPSSSPMSQNFLSETEVADHERRYRRVGEVSLRPRMGAGGAGALRQQPAPQPGLHQLPRPDAALGDTYGARMPLQMLVDLASSCARSCARPTWSPATAPTSG